MFYHKKTYNCLKKQKTHNYFNLFTVILDFTGHQGACQLGIKRAFFARMTPSSIYIDKTLDDEGVRICCTINFLRDDMNL